MRNYLVLLCLLFACENEPNTQPEVTCRTENVELLPGEEVMRVNYLRKPCEQEMENATCLMVQQGEDLCSEKWSYFYDEIEGFQYEEGYVYELKVRVEEVENPPMDGSSLRYILVEVLSKKEKK